ncbi:hypothetical protein LINPERHAP2_LOCUS37124 [Linum perenne]
MTIFTFCYILTVLLIFPAMQIRETNAQKRCIETLYPTGCTLMDWERSVGRNTVQ